MRRDISIDSIPIGLVQRIQKDKEERKKGPKCDGRFHKEYHVRVMWLGITEV